MAVPQEFAVLFTRTLDLFRDPNAKEDQKVQFRELTALLKTKGVVVAAKDGRLVIDNHVFNESGPYHSLVRRLEFHAVREIVIPPDPPLSDIFLLLRGLAEQPGDEDLGSRLRAGGVKQIVVEVQPVVTTTDIAPETPSPTPARSSQTPSDSASEGGEIPGIVRESMASSLSPSVPSTLTPAQLIAQLQEKPAGPNAGDILAVLGRQLETALKANRIPLALQIMVGVVRAEMQVTDATRRRQYSIALKRMYSKALLEAIAGVADHPTDREAALLVLRRAGEDGVEVLLDLLVAAPTIEERRGIFMALTGMKEGTDQLVHMLGHHQWFVVRNVAELAGELGLEEAVPALAQQLNHDDERVRKACALALAKIGSPDAAEPLRRALRDESPEVRMQAALGVAGRKSSALAMPLVVAMEEEEDETVERELMLALGRIATPAAVQALIKFAQPGGRLFGRQKASRRMNAVEALRIAATPAAIGTLEGLTDDGDKNIRGAAQSALNDLKRK